MKNIEVLRYAFGSESTLGLMFDISGGKRDFLCYVLEDAHRPVKIAGKTCIPAGTYEVKLRTEGTLTQRFAAAYPDIHKGMLWLQSVPDFQWVYIHTGNVDEDTEGCLLVGDGTEQNVTEPGKLSSSRSAYRRIYVPLANAIDGGERVVLTMREQMD